MFSNDYRCQTPTQLESKTFSQDRAPVNRVHQESERSKRSKGSGVKAISRGSSFFSFVRFLASRKVSSQEQASAVYEEHCDVFILWKIVKV